MHCCPIALRALGLRIVQELRDLLAAAEAHPPVS